MEATAQKQRRAYNLNVFINCPFDTDYKQIFDALVFAVYGCGFKPRCALEISNSAVVRITKIVELIAVCRYGIHDISRTELNKDNLPRFNMPLELGLFLGCQRFGGKQHKDKGCLILDRSKYRHQKFISDIAGQDVIGHNDVAKNAVTAVRDWLATVVASNRRLIGGQALFELFEQFQTDYPTICQKANIQVSEAQFIDYTSILSEWLKARAKSILLPEFIPSQSPRPVHRPTSLTPPLPTP